MVRQRSISLRLYRILALKCKFLRHYISLSIKSLIVLFLAIFLFSYALFIAFAKDMLTSSFLVFNWETLITSLLFKIFGSLSISDKSRSVEVK